MTIEGAIAQLQELIDNEGIPFWAKPSLQKVKETVEAERERYIEERKTGRWIKFDGHLGKWFCECGCVRLGKHRYCECCGAEMVNWRE